MKWKEKRANSLIDRDPKTNVKELPKKPNHSSWSKQWHAKPQWHAKQWQNQKKRCKIMGEPKKQWHAKPQQLVKTNPHNLFIFKLFLKYF
jgi:hypothetical protein